MPGNTLKYALFVLSLLVFIGFEANSQNDSLHHFDIIGDIHHSRYNFTDAIVPYYGVDGWTELKYAHWTDKNRRYAPYASMLGSWMFYMPQASGDIIRFDWQRYAQISAGIQWYPIEDDPLHAIRLFAFVAGRIYPSQDTEKTPYSDFVNYDFQAGADYYFDNLFDMKRKRNWNAIAAWSNLTFRLTNFSRKDYQALLWTGNVKWGWRNRPSGQSLLFSYILLDWTTTLPCPCSWWENYVHPGIGTRIYPLAFQKNSDEPNVGFFHRLHLYAEWLWEGFWLKGEPPERMKSWDLRFGFGFSTPGFFRDKDKRNNR
jgi:hypothetical protein